MPESDEEYDQGGLGSIEGPVWKYLSLVRKERELVEQLQEVRGDIEGMKKNSRLMTAIGGIERLQKKTDDPKGFAKLEEKRRAKAKAKAALSASPPEPAKDTSDSRKTEGTDKKRPGTAKDRLKKKLRTGPPPVDKSLQTDAERK